MHVMFPNMFIEHAWEKKTFPMTVPRWGGGVNSQACSRKQIKTLYIFFGRRQNLNLFMLTNFVIGWSINCSGSLKVRVLRPLLFS